MSMLLNPFVFATAGDNFGPGPDTITDLELWLDAYQETGFSDDQEMDTATDWSGNSRDFTGVSVGLKPRYKSTAGPDGRPTFLFHNQTEGSHTGDNQGGYFSRAGFMSGETAGHLFVVIRKVSDQNNNSGCPVGGFQSTTEDGYFPFGDGIIYEPWGTSVRKTTANPSVALDSWHLYEIRTASGAWSSWFDGVQLFSTGTNAVSFAGSTYLFGAGYQSDGTSIRRFTGWSSEKFIYSRVLNPTEITTVKDYLEAKHPSLTLA